MQTKVLWFPFLLAAVLVTCIASAHLPDSLTSWLMITGIVALLHTGPFFLGLGGSQVGRDRRPLDLRSAVLGYTAAIVSALYMRHDMTLIQYVSLSSVAFGLVTGVVSRRAALSNR